MNKFHNRKRVRGENKDYAERLGYFGFYAYL